MPITAIDIGAAPDDGTGDPLRRAFQITNENFADLDTTKADTTDVANALALKVDAVAGKGLSTADFTNEEKDKLDGVDENATYNRPDSETIAALALKADTTAVNAALALKADTTTVNAALALKADTTAVAPAIAMAQTFTAVPTTFQAHVIFVTQPHFRTFVWTGTKYERAPWHRPGEIVWYDGPPANVTNAIMMRSDVLYPTPSYPDLAEYYGFTGPTFSLKDARARVMRAADNGRNIDTALVNGYLQEDAYQGHRMQVALQNTVAGGSILSVTTTSNWAGPYENNVASTLSAQTVKHFTDGVNGTPRIASETRMKSFVATPYVVF